MAVLILGMYTRKILREGNAMKKEILALPTCWF